MKYNYFYWKVEINICFYKLPKPFFEKDKFINLSSDMKILYLLMLEKTYSDKKAVNIMNDFEKVYFLIERKRQGIRKSDVIYFKNIIEEILLRKQRILGWRL